MLSIRQHDEVDYANLPLIDEGDVGVITAADQQYLGAFGELLASRRATGRFGASLLHSHFPLGHGELMVEQADRAARTTTLRPRRNPGKAFPINVRFAPADTAVAYRMVGLEYVEDLAAVQPIGAQDAELFDETYALLARHGMFARFGVRLIHDPLGLENGSGLLETCDSRQRHLTCQVVDRGASDFAQSMPTFFTWQIVDEAVDGAVSQACRTVCNVTRACLSRPDGGHESHGSHDPNHESGD